MPKYRTADEAIQALENYRLNGKASEVVNSILAYLNERRIDIINARYETRNSIEEKSALNDVRRVREGLLQILLAKD